MAIDIRAKLDKVNQQLGEAQQRYAEVEHALTHFRKLSDELQSKNSAYASLGTILEHINKLESQDSIDLLWDDGDRSEQNRQRIEAALKAHASRLSNTQQRITTLQHELDRLEHETRALRAQQQDLQNRLNTIPTIAVSPQDIASITRVPLVLPWSNKRNDAIRLRVIMLVTLLAAVLLGYLIPRWKIPEAERIEYIEIPARLATLVVKKAPPPPPPEQQPQEEAEQPETPEPEPEPAPEPEQEQEQEQEEQASDARKAAEQTGLLAFRQDFVEIMDATSNIKMGSQATIITSTPGQYSGPAARSLITSKVDFANTGTGNAAVRRTDVVDVDNKLKQVEFTHIETPEPASVDSKQPATQRTKPGRSDEEIQVVFDRYKDALYRIYNRELRKNSFLKGKLVLQLTIEPNGKVSNCLVDSSDLNSAELENKIVARVRRFNFGEKKGAAPLTILYPIEFLPSS